MAKNRRTKIFTVERIVGRKIGPAGKVVYQVRWKGYGPNEDTWEPAENFINSDVVKNYEMQREQNAQRRKEAKEIKEEQEATPQRTDPATMKLTPITVSFSSRSSSRNRKPTYKRSLLEQPSRAGSSISPDLPASTSMAPGPMARPSRLRQRPSSGQNERSSTGQSPSTSTKTLSSSRNSSVCDGKLSEVSAEDLSKTVDMFEEPKMLNGILYNPHTGILSASFTPESLDILIAQMDEALNKIDGYLIEDDDKYKPLNIILVAKRPLGFVAYIRVALINAPTRCMFECVPLEIMISYHPQLVLSYMEEQLCLDYQRRNLIQTINKRSEQPMDVDQNITA